MLPVVGLSLHNWAILYRRRYGGCIEEPNEFVCVPPEKNAEMARQMVEHQSYKHYRDICRDCIWMLCKSYENFNEVL